MIRMLHTLWRQIPRDLRKKMIAEHGLGLSTRALRNREIRPGPVTVAGLLRSTTGIGQGARLCLDALSKSGADVRHKDIGEWFHWLQKIDVELGPEAEADSGGAMIIHLNPVELAVALPLLGQAFLRHKRIIGYWAWELSYLPPEWRKGISLVDEIWAPSRFVADAIRPYARDKVRVVPHPVTPPETSNLGRAHFGIPDHAFAALMMFDLRSCASRKNPFDAITAFRKAFGDRDDVCLIIKIGAPDESPAIMRQIREHIQGATNIRLIFDILSPADQGALIRNIDTLISLHRSEGFGLALAEAMALGKPVIATGYSGNLDFMNHDNSLLIDHRLTTIRDSQKMYNFPNASWAQPDVDQASEWLKRLEASRATARAIGEAARESIARQFALPHYMQMTGQLLEAPWLEEVSLPAGNC